MRIYQAGPLFSQAEQEWHRRFKARLTAEGFDAVWPFELPLPDDMSGGNAARMLMETDRAALDSCDAVAALLDGPQVDDGTAWEIGYAFCRGLPVVGIRTDFRKCGDAAGAPVNAMIAGSCRTVVTCVEDAVAALREIREGK